jgi:hypothetical protein
MDLPVVPAPGDELLRLAARMVNMQLLRLLGPFFIFNKISADSPEAINSPNFL